jgi:DNA-binding CsgD family transcriptional regulator
MEISKVSDMLCGQQQESGKKLSFYIASENNYFISGFIALLEIQEEKHGSIFEYKTTDCTLKGVRVISDTLNEEKGNRTLIVVADSDMLGAVFLNVETKSHLFIDVERCKHDFIESVSDRAYIMRLVNHHYVTTMQMKLCSLTNKEKRICHYMAKGFSSKFIGMNLGIHEKTVSGYRNSIIRKIGCDNKIGLYKFINTHFKKLNGSGKELIIF